MNLTRRLPSHLEQVPALIASFLEEIKKEINVDEEDEFKVRLILEEALTNAIKHGNRLNPKREVEISLQLENERLAISIKDQGEGFDFRHVPDPREDDKLLRTSGRGIFLIRKNADKVDFDESGRQIHIVKYLKKTL